MAEWVATSTFVDESAGMFYEEGGIYDHDPATNCRGRGGDARELIAPEHTAACPHCGQRFAATENGAAEKHRDLHFDGDEDIPSICRNLPTKRPNIVGKKAGAS